MQSRAQDPGAWSEAPACDDIHRPVRGAKRLTALLPAIVMAVAAIAVTPSAAATKVKAGTHSKGCPKKTLDKVRRKDLSAQLRIELRVRSHVSAQARAAKIAALRHLLSCSSSRRSPGSHGPGKPGTGLPKDAPRTQIPAFLSPEAGTTSAPGSSALTVSVRGNRLVDGSGEPVTLHGVDISGTEWQCLYGQAFYGPSDAASIAAIAAWHANAVRIPLNEDCWLGINGAPTDVASYREAIRAYVLRLQAAGIYAILDLHWSAPGATLSHLGPGYAGFFEMADEDHAPAFWESVASYFKEVHSTVFDLFNEPTGVSWSCWRNGCMTPGGFQAAGMQQLVDVVRGTGATQPIMLGGLEDANELGSEWLRNRPVDPDDALVASAHLYGWQSTGQLEANLAGVALSVPVVVGELGEKDCASSDIDHFMPWADAHGISYLAWAWFTGDCASYPSLISSYGGVPTAYGLGYREHLLATFPAPGP